MRWLALLLLAGNVIYLGWELDRETKALAANSRPAVKLPAASAALEKIDEAAGLPELHSVPGWYGPRRVLAPLRR